VIAENKEQRTESQRGESRKQRAESTGKAGNKEQEIKKRVRGWIGD
jgi:hypothetical protein